ncbi:amidase [Pandoraea sp. PE-S2R-1]|uniref:amidase n=1 Tax=Pandoraea sp. PE-S2R-1 TaxID=1986994 RepID=UPI000B3F69FA|nr:amidase [Pandoraea sp. PE-S2R-1]
MTGNPLRLLSATEAQKRIARKELSALEYVAALLEAIAAENDTLSAFIEIYREEALAAAHQADVLMARGEVTGPLHGLPFAVKDLMDVEGKRTTAQSHVLRDPVAKRDADVVRQLRAAGAILIGKLSLEEFGIGSPSDTLPWPPARNPWDIERIPGGSSSGCGVALAACQVPLAIGSDTAGSVRNPAAMCGVIGLKPTYELLSRRGVFPLAPSLDHVGLMTRSAEDCALLLGALKHPSRRENVDFTLEGAPLHGLKVGLLSHFYRRDIIADDETQSAIGAAAGEIARLGARLDDVDAGDLESFRRCGSTLLRVEAYAVHREFLARSPERYGERCRDTLLAGALISAQEYVDAKRQQLDLTDRIDRLLETSEVLLTGVSAHTAARFDDEDAVNRPANQMRVPFNVSGHPALAFCVGFSSSGLPIGAQLIGRRFEEEKLLAVAAAYQRVTTWHFRHPSVALSGRDGVPQ